MGDNKMTTEAQKRASKRYYLKNKDYYFEKSRENSKKVRLERNDYKARIDKAINKIQYIIDYGFDYDGFNKVESLKGLIDMLVDYARETKNILQGDSNDN